MQHLFNAKIIPSTINVQVGDDSLKGVFYCDHCTQQCAQRNRFQTIRVKEDGTRYLCGNYCLPECAAAACNVTANEFWKHYKRRVFCAPEKSALHSVKRKDWINTCRANLTSEELEIANAELSVQKLEK